MRRKHNVRIALVGALAGALIAGAQLTAADQYLDYSEMGRLTGTATYRSPPYINLRGEDTYPVQPRLGRDRTRALPPLKLRGLGVISGQERRKSARRELAKLIRGKTIDCSYWPIAAKAGDPRAITLKGNLIVACGVRPKKHRYCKKIACNLVPCQL